MATENKERQIIRVSESGASERKASSNKAASSQSKPPKKRANGLRIGAVVLWLVAIVFEVLTILLLNGTFYIPGNEMAYLIVGIVLDLACVIAGSQLWKKANRIDPASKKNKVKFFFWNQMGVIAAVIAFVPLVVLLLKDKDLDPKTKKIVSIVAAVAALLAVGTSIDYNPVSKEELTTAQEEAYSYNDGVVYWTPFGKCYHYDTECQSLKNSNTLYEGTIEESFEANRTRGCSFCTDPEVIDAFRTTSDSDISVSPSDIIDDLLAPAA